MSSVTLADARKAKATLVRRLRLVPVVVGIGITRVDGHYAVKVNLSQPDARAARIPRAVGGVPVCVETTGTIRKR